MFHGASDDTAKSMPLDHWLHHGLGLETERTLSWSRASLERAEYSHSDGYYADEFDGPTDKWPYGGCGMHMEALPGTYAEVVARPRPRLRHGTPMCLPPRHVTAAADGATCHSLS